MCNPVPYLCPVCVGRGTVAHDFYDPKPVFDLDNTYRPTGATIPPARITCRTCYGAGIVMVPANSPPMWPAYPVIPPVYPAPPVYPFVPQPVNPLPDPWQPFPPFPYTDPYLPPKPTIYPQIVERSNTHYYDPSQTNVTCMVG